MFTYKVGPKISYKWSYGKTPASIRVKYIASFTPCIFGHLFILFHLSPIKNPTNDRLGAECISSVHEVLFQGRAAHSVEWSPASSKRRLGPTVKLWLVGGFKYCSLLGCPAGT